MYCIIPHCDTLTYYLHISCGSRTCTSFRGLITLLLGPVRPQYVLSFSPLAIFHSIYVHRLPFYRISAPLLFKELATSRVEPGTQYRFSMYIFWPSQCVRCLVSEALPHGVVENPRHSEPSEISSERLHTMN